MIKRLKIKYSFVVMSAFTAVLLLIILAINSTNYSLITSLIDDKIKLIIENEGQMPEFPIPPEEPGEGDPGQDDPGGDGVDQPGNDPDGPTDPSDPNDPNGSDSQGGEDGKDKNEEEDDPRQNMSPETPFETRYFTVKFNTDGGISSVDTSKIVAVSPERAEDYAVEMLAKDKERGYLKTYRFMQGLTEDGCVIFVFVDAYRELEAVRTFLISSFVISGIGLVIVFLLVILLSESALRPIIESYEKQKRFITDAGHEMKTPLTVISANTEIIEMESGESQWTEGIKSQVSKLASLTEKLVILSKMEEGAKLEMSEFSLSDAFYDTSKQYKSIAMSKGIRFDIEVPDGVTMIGNEGEIRRCISLLLDNAFRYVDKDGFVRVNIQKHQSGVLMKFSNSTGGVEKGSLDRWFDRFYRTDLSRNSDTGGSGIGLSVVKAVVNAHGGSVHAHSEDGNTVEFTIDI